MLHIFYEQDALPWRMPFARSELRCIMQAMQEATGTDGYSVELTLCNDATIATLNAEYMGCSGATNILSFPTLDAYNQEEYSSEYPNGDEQELSDAPYPISRENDESSLKEPLVLGSLVLSIDTLLREAYLYGQDNAEHCIRLLAHGLAHIAGYDHSEEMEAFEACAREAAFERVQITS